MAKQGMKRISHGHRKNDVPPVPILSGKAKSGKEKANPLIPNGGGKVYHTSPYEGAEDLAVENLMDGFDMTGADLQDFTR